MMRLDHQPATCGVGKLLLLVSINKPTGISPMAAIIGSRAMLNTQVGDFVIPMLATI